MMTGEEPVGSGRDGTVVDASPEAGGPAQPQPQPQSQSQFQPQAQGAAEASPLARREFDWNLLHTFMVIVEEGSITRAANRLLLRQPSVSNALKRLEDRLGQRLIDRAPGRFELTDQGTVLYRECQDICGAIGRLGHLMIDGEADLDGHIRLVLASHVVFPPLDSVLARFHAQHPLVTLDIEVARSSVVAQTVLSRQASAGIGLVGQPHPQLDYRLLFREHFGFFCGPAHRLFGRRDLTVDDLRAETFVSFGTDSPNDALRAIAVLRAHHRLDGRTVGTAANLEEVRRMIVAGLGIGPLPIHAVARDVRDGLLWRLPPYDPVPDTAVGDPGGEAQARPPAVDIFLVTNPRTNLSRAERLFLDLLTAELHRAPGGVFVYPESLAAAGESGALARPA
ncbi:LysR family transcriptional regulator [Roseospira goensis]|uniref:DNA-binding transcriptional LysR family regulator n=1 Tax=Roseospira goensis TaxID=391922 RepID=A0A7W6S1U3_9PROT|nr:LysR family transcriptional regulator [Roseospira goensis]MBB4287328.1 DNA-binding transcriptional LysR family regulator [Roseospira goensis]